MVIQTRGEGEEEQNGFELLKSSIYSSLRGPLLKLVDPRRLPAGLCSPLVVAVTEVSTRHGCMDPKFETRHLLDRR
jgi:hypothetical protein